MSSTLRARGQALRLASLLDTDVDDLDFLIEQVPAATIAALRDQITEVLFDASGDRLKGAASAAALLPAPVAASLAEKAMGPAMCALLAGSLDDRRLVDIAKRLPAPFLAEVAVRIDPRRVPDVVATMPPKRVAAVATELVARGEYVTMGQFAAYLGPEATELAIATLDDDDLLRTAFMVDDDARLEEILAGLPDERVVGLLDAARRTGLWFEAIGIVQGQSDDGRRRLADLAVAHDPHVIGDLAAFTQEHGLWDAVLPLVGAVGPEGRRALAELDVFHRADVLASIVTAAADADLWADLLPLVPDLPDHAQRHVAVAVLELDPEVVHAAIAAAAVDGRADGLVQILRSMSDPEQAGVLDEVVRRTARQKTWTALLPLVPLLPAGTRQLLADRAAALTDRDLAALVKAVHGSDLWEPWLQVAAVLTDPDQQRLRIPFARLPQRVQREVGHRARALDLAQHLGPLQDLLRPDR